MMDDDTSATFAQPLTKPPALLRFAAWAIMLIPGSSSHRSHDGWCYGTKHANIFAVVYDANEPLLDMIFGMVEVKFGKRISVTVNFTSK